MTQKLLSGEGRKPTLLKNLRIFLKKYKKGAITQKNAVNGVKILSQTENLTVQCLKTKKVAKIDEVRCYMTISKLSNKVVVEKGKNLIILFFLYDKQRFNFCF